MPQETHANAAAPRAENLALIFQELFTAIVRLRSNRQQVSDSESFRDHIREAVKNRRTGSPKSGRLFDRRYSHGNSGGGRISG